VPCIPDMVTPRKLSQAQARVLRKCQRRNERLQKALEINQLISSELQLGLLLQLIMEVTQKVMEAEACSLFLLDAETGDLVFQVALGESGDKLKELYRLPRGTGIAGWVAEHVQPVLQNDVYSDKRFNPDYDRQTGFHTRNMLCVPVRYGDVCIAVCQVINRIGGDFSEDDLHLLEPLSIMAAVAIENARVHQKLMEQTLMEHDLSLAHQLQQSFLPQEPPRTPGYSCAFINRTAFEVGGDLYDAFSLPDNRVAYLLGDVSGKGVAAALIMSRVLKDLRFEAIEGGSAGEIITRFNHGFCNAIQHGMFVTLILILLNPETGHVEIANAGHLPPVVRYGDLIRFGEQASGPPVGIVSMAGYQTQEMELRSGETILLYTDGVTEARNPEGEMLGEDNMLAWLAGAPDGSVSCVDYMCQRVQRFAGSTRQSDDITLLALSRYPS